MEEIRLITPSIAYADDLMAFREELLRANDADAFAGCSGLENCASAQEWLEVLDRYAWGRVEGCVPSNTYLAVRMADNRIVGVIDLRHHIDHPILGLWGGHIGYSVRPSERGHGYAREMLRLNLANCRALGLKRIMVTCHPSNPASEKTILGNGGVFEREVEVEGHPIRRYWIDLS